MKMRRKIWHTALSIQNHRRDIFMECKVCNGVLSSGKVGKTSNNVSSIRRMNYALGRKVLLDPLDEAGLQL